MKTRGCQDLLERTRMKYMIGIRFILCVAIAFLFTEPAHLTVAIAQSHNAATTKDFGFDVVSIHEVQSGYGTPRAPGFTPDGYRANATLGWMIKYAYGRGEPMPLPDGDGINIINLPNWADHRYMIDARVDERDLKAWQQRGQNLELLRSGLRKILTERFHLALHAQQVERDGYHLVVGKKGITFRPAPQGEVPPPGRRYADGGVSRPPSQEEITKAGMLQQRFYNASMADLASFLNLFSDRPIYDKTGLDRHYDFTVNQLKPQPEDAANMLDMFQIKELGLSLRPGRGPGLDLIIDHVDRPTPN